MEHLSKPAEAWAIVSDGRIDITYYFDSPPRITVYPTQRDAMNAGGHEGNIVRVEIREVTT